ncbi:MAG: hypothetical protein KBG04_07605 [Bacteroidales bacterium]|nr:hypothetical protein [Bacteroidales bacterium]
MEKSSRAYKTFITLCIFGIAMGYLEAVVVVYLRELNYPQGFAFPLSIFPMGTLWIEWGREFATIVMLATIGIVSGKNFLQRFSYFLFTFAIWDIFYYVFLKLTLNWPQSLLTWDILFLIPVPWVGPVLAPIICSLTMILLSFAVVFMEERGYTVTMKVWDWVLMLLGAFIVFCTFIHDYFIIIFREGLTSGFGNLATNPHLQEMISKYVPTSYNWFLFSVGEILILTSIALIFRRAKSTAQN